MSESETPEASAWLKTPYANLIRYQSSGKYFARVRIQGKLIVRSLGTTAITVAKPRLADLEKEERQRAQSQAATANGTMTIADALAVLIRFLAFGGFRKSEAAKITWADIDLAKETILVRGDEQTGAKNWEVRVVPMIPEMKALIEGLQAERPDRQPTDPVMRAKECQRSVDTVCKTIGTPRFTHHGLRHMFMTRRIESDVDIPAASRWLGHKDGGALAMKRYGRLRDAHSADMAKRVRFLNPEPADPTSPETEVA